MVEDRFRMTGLRSSETGLPFYVWLQAKAGAQHDVHIRCSPTFRGGVADDTVVALRPELHVVSRVMSKGSMALVAEFVLRNTEAINAYWEERIDGIDAEQRICPVTSRPTSIAEVARRLAARPDYPLWLPLCEFLDEFYESKAAPEMLQEEPQALADKRHSAFLAASVEYLAEVYQLDCPAWALNPKWVLAEPYYTWDWEPGPAVKALFDVESPPAFRRRLIFTEMHPLRRKLGPKS